MLRGIWPDTLDQGHRFGLVLLGVFVVCLFAGSVSAQDPSENAEAGSLVHSAKLPKDRLAQTKYDRAVQAAQEEQLILAVDLLRELLEGDSQSWIQIRVKDSPQPGPDQLRPNRSPQKESWVNSRDAALRILDLLGAPGRRLYEEQSAASAKATLQEAIESGNASKLRDVVVRFGSTREGLTALRFLAAQSLDRGLRQTADATYRRVLNHPLVDEAGRKAALRGIISIVPDEESSEKPAGSTPGTLSERHEKTDIAELVPFRGEPLWELSTALDDETSNAIADALHEHTQQSIPILLRARPFVAGDSALIRSPGRVRRVDSKTGTVHWDNASSTSASSVGTRITTNLSMQNLMARNLAKELQIDSVTSAFRVRGQSVLYIETAPRDSTQSNQPGGAPIRLRAVGPFNSRVVVPGRNRVVHCDLETGQASWVFSGRAFFSVLKETPQQTDSVYFLGPPEPIDNLFWGLAQVGSEIRLYALRQNGELDWQTTVCETERQLQNDVDWRFLACPVVKAGGVLVCPTGTGLVVAFDLVTRTPLWAQRYPREDLVETSGRIMKGRGGTATRHWWKCWRELTVAHIDGPTPLAVVASPDQLGLSLFNLRTGEEIWTRQLEAPMSLVATTGLHAVVTEQRCVCAFDLKSGEPAWRTEIPEISGRGYTIGSTRDPDATPDYYVFPTQDRRLNAVCLSDGQLTRTSMADSSPAGNLVRIGDVVLEQTAEKITAWRILADCLVPKSRLRPATIAAAEATAGRFVSSVARWQSVLAADADEPLTGNARRSAQKQLWQTLANWLADESVARNQIEPRMRELIDDADIQREIELTHTLARTFVANGDSEAALDRYFQVLNLNPSGDEPVHFAGPLRMVRHDRLILGELLNLASDEREPRDLDSRSALQRRFAEQLQQARSSPDPFAAQRLASRLSGHPWAATLHLDEKSEVGRTFLQKQLSLLQLAGSSDVATAAPALERLAELYQNRSHNLDAASTSLKLSNLLESKPQVDVRSVLARPDDLPDRAALLKSVQKSDWQDLNASVEVEKKSAPAADFRSVIVECEAGSLFERLDVSVTQRLRRNTRTVRFCGDGEAGAWKIDVPFPQTSTRNEFALPRGWGVGHLLILEIGGKLLAISPYSQNGEPKPLLVWSRDMVEGNRMSGLQIERPVPGFISASVNYLDPFDRVIATVGPVRSAYLCVQTRGRLVCLDTESGQLLWERYELPRNAICTGDDETIYLLAPDRARVELLRPTDGAEVATHPLDGFQPAFASNPAILMTGRSCALIRNSGEDQQASVVDLKTGRPSWSLPKDAANLFRADDQTVGHLSADGKLTLLDLKSGRAVANLEVEVPATIDSVACTHDRNRWFVAIHTVENAGKEELPITFSTPLNGRLVAVNRADGRLLWERSVLKAQLPLAQPGSIPVLVLVWTERGGPGDSRIDDTFYHLIDKRTGETLYENPASGNDALFLVEPDPSQRRVEIRTNRRTFRIDYAAN
jgi:outer membrane protein assembly factor BamB